MSAAYNAMMEECTKAQIAEMFIDLMGESRRLRVALDNVRAACDGQCSLEHIKLVITQALEKS